MPVPYLHFELETEIAMQNYNYRAPEKYQIGTIKSKKKTL